MISIEEYIRNNKEKLDSEDPSPDHELFFEKRLKEKFHKKNRYVIRYAATIAASVLIFVLSWVYVYIKKSEGYTGAIETVQWIEFKEAEQYYSMQTEEAVAKLKETLAVQPRNISSPLLNEFEDMETSYKQLKRDLKDNPNDIRLMSAVVQYHQLKLELINNLIERFTLYSNTKNKKHEKSNI